MRWHRRPRSKRVSKSWRTRSRRFAENCYYTPLSWTLWGTMSEPTVQGLRSFVMPDGSLARDGAGFPGTFWTQTMFVGE